jgi:hypothetical protein
VPPAGSSGAATPPLPSSRAFGTGSDSGAGPGMGRILGGLTRPGFASMPSMSDDPRVAQAMASVAAAQSHPLSRSESLEVLDQLKELGILDEKTRAEVGQCLEAGGARAEGSMGVGMAMFKSTVLPMLLETKARFADLSPDEQEHLAEDISEQLKQSPEREREEFLQGFGTGLFPEAVVQKVRADFGQR